MAEKRAWKSGLAISAASTAIGLGLQMEIDRIAQRLGAAVSRRDRDGRPGPAHGRRHRCGPAATLAGALAAEGEDRVFERLLDREPIVLALPADEAACRHIRSAGGSGSWQHRAGRQAEAAQEIRRRPGPPCRRAGAVSRRSAPCAAGDGQPVVEQMAGQRRRPSTASAARTLTRSPAISHQAPGRGCRARTWRSSCARGLGANRAAPPRGSAWRHRWRPRPAAASAGGARPPEPSSASTISAAPEARPAGRAGCRRSPAGRSAMRSAQQHRAGIEPLVHLHDGDAGLPVAGEDGALDRRRAAPARQQRGMDVEAAEPRRLQDRAAAGSGHRRRPRRHRGRGAANGLLRLGGRAGSPGVQDRQAVLLPPAPAPARDAAAGRGRPGAAAGCRPRRCHGRRRSARRGSPRRNPACP